MIEIRIIEIGITGIEMNTNPIRLLIRKIISVSFQKAKLIAIF